MEENVEGVTLNDALIRKVSRAVDPRKLSAFRYDYSPSTDKLIQINPIEKFKWIRELSLIGHSLTDISCIQSLEQLKRLNLSWNRIRDFNAILRLTNLEELTLNHNQIRAIPSEISSLANLKILRIAYNQIQDRRDFVRMQPAVNIVNLDIEGNPIARDNDSLLYCVFTLPQLLILNRSVISIEYRRRAAERFERFQIEELNASNEHLYQQNEELKSKIKEQEDEADRFERMSREMMNVRDNLANAENQYKQVLIILKQKDSDLEAERKKIMGVQAERDSLASKLQKLSEELKRREEFCDKVTSDGEKMMQDFQTEREKTLDEIEQLKTDQNAQTLEIERLTTENKALRQTVEKLSSENSVHLSNIEKLENDLEQERRKLLAASPRQARSPSSNVAEERLRQLQEKNFRLLDELEAARNELAVKLRENESFRKEIENLKRQIRNDEDDPIDKEIPISSVSDLAEEKRNLITEKFALESEILALKKELSNKDITIGELKNEIKRLNEAATKNAMIVDDMKKLRKQLDETKKQLSLQEDEERAASETMRATMRMKEDEVADLKAKLAKQGDEHSVSLQRIAASDKSIQELQAMIADMKQKSDAIERSSVINQRQISDLKAQNEELLRQRELLEQNLEQIREEARNIERQRKDAISKLEQAQEEQQKTKTSLSDITRKYEELARKCPALQQSLSVATQKIEDLEELNQQQKSENEILETRNGASQREIENLRKEVEELSNKIKALRNEISELRNANVDLKEEARKKGAQVELDKAKHEEESWAFQQEISQLKQTNEQFKAANDELRNQIRTQNEQLRENSSEIQKLCGEKDQYFQETERLKDQEKLLNDKIEKLQERVTSLTDINEKNSSIIDSVKSKMQMLKDVGDQNTSTIKNLNIQLDSEREIADQKIGELQKAIAELEKKNQTLSIENRDLSKEKGQLESSIASLKNSIEQSETTLTAMQETAVPIERFTETSQNLENAQCQIEEQKKRLDEQSRLIEDYSRQKQTHETVATELRHTIELLQDKQKHDVELRDAELSSAKARAQQFEESIDKLNRELFELRQDARKSDQENKSLTGQLSTARIVEGELRNRLEIENREIEILREQNKKLKAFQGDILKENSQLRENAKALTSQKIELERRLVELQGKAKSLKQSVQRNTEVNKQKDSTIESLSKKLENVEADRLASHQQLSSTTQENSNLKEKVKGLLEETRQLKETVDDLQTQSLKLTQATSTIEEHQKALAEKKAKMREMKGKLSDLSQSNEELTGKISILEERLESLTYANSDMKDQIDSGSEMIQSLQLESGVTTQQLRETLNRLEQVRTERDRLKRSLDKIQTSQAELNAENTTLKKQMRLFEETHLTNTSQIDDLTSQVQELTENNNRDSANLGKLNMELAQAKAKIVNLKQKNQTLTNENQELLARNQQLSNSIEQSEVTITALHETSIPIDRFRETSQDLENARARIEDQSKQLDEQRRLLAEYERNKESHASVTTELHHRISLLQNKKDHDDMTHDDKVKSLQETIKKLAKKLQTTKAELKTVKADLFVKTETLRTAEEMIKRLKGQISNSEEETTNNLTKVISEANGVKAILKKKEDDLEKLKIVKLKNEQRIISLESQLQLITTENTRLNKLVSDLKQENLRKTEELAKCKSKCDALEKQIGNLTRQINTQSKDIEKLTGANDELNQTVTLLEQQRDSRADDLGRHFSSSQKSLQSKLRRYKDKLSSLEQDNARLKAELEIARNESLSHQKRIESVTANLRAKDQKSQVLEKSNAALKTQSSSLASALRSLHSFLTVYGSKVEDPTSLLSDITSRLQRLFADLSLAPISLSIKRRQFKRVVSTAVSIPPNPDESRFIPPAHAHLISSMRQELMSFPIRTPTKAVNPTARMTTQLEQLRALVLLVKRLFQERESHIEDMARLIASQHAAVMRLSKNSANRELIALSEANSRMAQAIIERDRASRREFQNAAATP